MEQSITEDRVIEAIERDWLPQLEWMKSFKSLVLVKLGPYGRRGCGARVISILLDSLVCGYLFPGGEKKPTPRPLRCIWIENFEVCPYKALRYANPECLQSFKTGDPDGYRENYESFPNLENLDGMVAHNISKSPLPSASKLRYYCGRGYTYEEVNFSTLFK